MNLTPEQWLGNLERGGSSVPRDDPERVKLEVRRVARRLSTDKGYCSLHLPIVRRRS